MLRDGIFPKSAATHSLREIVDMVCAEAGLSLDALRGRCATERLANARSCVAILSLKFGPVRCGSALDRVLDKGDGCTRRLRADHGRRAEQLQSYRMIYARCLNAIQTGASLPAPESASPHDVGSPTVIISPVAVGNYSEKDARHG